MAKKSRKAAAKIPADKKEQRFRAKKLHKMRVSGKISFKDYVKRMQRLF